MRRNFGLVAVMTALLVAAVTFFAATPQASAQDMNEIVEQLESDGYYIEPGAEGSDSRFSDLVRQGDQTGDTWYFVSMADTVSEDFADDLFDEVNPQGNVLVYFLDGDFVNVQLATDASESVETRALAPFDGDWDQPEDFMADVVTEFESLTAATSSGNSTTTTTTSSGSGSSDSGGGFPWGWLAVPAVIGGGFWFMNHRGKKKKAEDDLENAQKIRAELQTEIDELANDVLVLSGPVDLSENEQAIDFYRAATDTYLTISDEIPDMAELKAASMSELAEIGTRVTHARWQMDAAEAILDGEPIPEKPKVEPPPAPPKPPEARAQQRERQRQRLPQHQPRPRVPYSRSRSRSRSGGGLLDILIAGGSMMGSSRRGGGMFGGSSRSRSQPSRTQERRPGGGVFGSGSGSRTSSRSSSSRSSSRSSSSRSRNRRSSSGSSTSKRRRR